MLLFIPFFNALYRSLDSSSEVIKDQFIFCFLLWHVGLMLKVNRSLWYYIQRITFPYHKKKKSRKEKKSLSDSEKPVLTFQSINSQNRVWHSNHWGGKIEKTMSPYSTHSLPVKQQVDNALPSVIKTEQLKHFKYRSRLFYLAAHSSRCHVTTSKAVSPLLTLLLFCFMSVYLPILWHINCVQVKLPQILIISLHLVFAEFILKTGLWGV